MAADPAPILTGEMKVTRPDGTVVVVPVEFEAPTPQGRSLLARLMHKEN